MNLNGKKDQFLVNNSWLDLIQLLDDEKEEAYTLRLIFYYGLQGLDGQPERPTPPESPSKALQKLESKIEKESLRNAEKYILSTEKSKIKGFLNKIKSDEQLSETKKKLKAEAEKRSLFLNDDVSWSEYIEQFQKDFTDCKKTINGSYSYSDPAEDEIQAKREYRDRMLTKIKDNG